jgi:hypothetical protein
MPKISGLPTATAVLPSDFIVVVDNAAVPETKKATANLLSALAPVQTVAGRIGAVVLSSSDVGLGNVNNTADADKPVSTAQQTALDLKAPIASPTFTGTVGGVTKSMVGLGNVDDTSDANKPVSAAQQSALDLKAPIANPTFTGTVAGVTKSMVGLGNVDDTADANKPVSTAQSTADTAVQNYAVQRANHTGTQNAATISDFATAAALYEPVTSVAGKTGAVTIGTADVSGLDTLLSKTVYSNDSGLSGATTISNIVALTQAAYDAIVTPQATTLYVIRDV